MITNIPNLGMNYVNYKTSIVQKYHTQLLGWPSEIPFVNPHQLTSTAAAKSLLNALTVSTCKWVAMSKRQQREHAVMLAADVEGGRVVGKKRKVRSDKGKRRGKQGADDVDDEDDDVEEDDEEGNNNSDENEQPMPAKKQKSSASRMKPKLTARRSDAATTSSKSKASAAKKAKRVTKRLPPAASKSKEFIDSDSEDDSDI
jgi:hypothetical protein